MRTSYEPTADIAITDIPLCLPGTCTSYKPLPLFAPTGWHRITSSSPCWRSALFFSFKRRNKIWPSAWSGEATILAWFYHIDKLKILFFESVLDTFGLQSWAIW